MVFQSPLPTFELQGCSPRQKKLVLTFLRCLKWVFHLDFSPFKNVFWFHLITSKWDQEVAGLAIYPLRMSSGCGRYMNWRGSLKQGSLDHTPLIYNILQNNVLCYIQNSNLECGTCKLYTFQLNRPMQSNWTPLNIYFIAYENFH